MISSSRKHTPYLSAVDYHPQSLNESFPGLNKYKTFVGDLRYIADFNRQDLSYVICGLGAALYKPMVWHWLILKVTLCYLVHTRNYGIYFRKIGKKTKFLGDSFKTQPTEACLEIDSVNNKKDIRLETGGLLT